ncbi:hypothetical protein [Alkalihalophilus marmarensis]|uniref:hypothetical protein n=1 Tax=Alkalihalophilus marmarensis TaxID=521377 RepID=UPI002DBC60F4|nr:hypothetical protein [Alkalihalophilus marmarensis]MEC2074440.1 hypothetical protein [Alkalihalophilus marmarensis]
MTTSTLIEETIVALKPKIKKALYQTSLEHREDLEQELNLKIISHFNKLDISDIPGFFEIAERDN